jgi:acyl-CoA dehydrogenase
MDPGDRHRATATASFPGRVDPLPGLCAPVTPAAPADLATFAEEVEAFLSSQLSTSPSNQAAPPAGGAPRLEIHGLERRDDGAVAAAVAAAIRWQAARFDAGLGWLTGPPRYGGRGLGTEYEDLYLAREASYGAPDTTPLNVGTKLLSSAVLAHGTDDQCRRVLPALHRGDVVGCQLFSEPDAGSDLAAVRTTATRCAGGWELEGTKVWTSKAQFADHGLCLARTGAGVAHHGLTMFLVDMHAPGVEVQPLRQMNGQASFSQVTLSKVALNDAQLVGTEGEGWAVVRTTLASERAAVGRGRPDPALAAWDALRALPAETRTAPGVRHALADLYAHVRIAELSASRAQRTGAPGPGGSANKLMRGRNLQSAADLAGQVRGAQLLVGEDSWSDLVTCAPGVRIAGGTDEIQRNVLAERVLGLPREPRRSTEPRRD